MDWKTVAATFAMVFLAELGDKTQIALFTLTAEGKPRLAVLLGGCLALVASTVVAVAAGSILQESLTDRHRRWVRVAAGLLFVAMGVLLLLGREGD